MEGKIFARAVCTMFVMMMCWGGCCSEPERAEAACLARYGCVSSCIVQRSEHNWLWPLPNNKPQRPSRYNRPGCGNGNSGGRYNQPHRHHPYRGHR